MRIEPRLLLLLCGLVLWFGTVQADDKNAHREKLDTAIAEGARQLEAKEYLTFIKNFVPPEQLKKFGELGNLEEFANKFGEKKGPQLLAVLKSLKGATPQLEKDGKQATFDIKVDGNSKNKIVFMKIEKYWYINN